MKQARRMSDKVGQRAAVCSIQEGKKNYPLQKRQVQRTWPSRTPEGCFSVFLFNPVQEQI